MSEFLALELPPFGTRKMIHGSDLPNDDLTSDWHARNESHLAPSDGLFGRPVPFLGHFLVAAKGLRSVILCSYAISTLCTHMKHEASKLKTQTLKPMGFPGYPGKH